MFTKEGKVLTTSGRRGERYVRNMGCNWLQIESLCMLGYAARACMSRRGLSRACFSLMSIGVENWSGQQGEWGSTSRRTARCEVQA